MDKKILWFLLLAVALVASVWTYKGNELQDNQILVFLTGTDITLPSPAAQSALDTRPDVEPGSTVQVRINGRMENCQVTGFTIDSQAVGNVLNGRLENSVSIGRDHPFLYWRPKTIRDGTGLWGTTELFNSLELGACAAFARTGSKTRINDLSKKNGGGYQPHITHTNGLDADIALFCKDGSATTHCSDWKKFDPEASWVFARALAEKTRVKRILLHPLLIYKIKQYVEANEPGYLFKNEVFSSGRNSLFIGDIDHYHHFHVQFRCPQTDSQCVDGADGFLGVGEGPIPDEGMEETDEEGISPPTESVPLTVQSDAALLSLADRRSPRCLYFTDAELNPLVQRCSQRYGINPNLVKAIIMAESYGPQCNYNGGEPRAVSVSNARGLMQIISGTVTEINTYRTTSAHEAKIAGNAIFNPSVNICAGTQLLAIMWSVQGSRYGITSTANLVQAYNVGPAGFRSGSRNLDYLSKVSSNYRRLTGALLPATPAISGGSVNYVGEELLGKTPVLTEPARIA